MGAGRGAICKMWQGRLYLVCLSKDLNEMGWAMWVPGGRAFQAEEQPVQRPWVSSVEEASVTELERGGSEGIQGTGPDPVGPCGTQ